MADRPALQTAGPPTGGPAVLLLDLGGVLVQLDEEAFRAAWGQLGVAGRDLARFMAGPRNRDWNLGRIPPEEFPRVLRRELLLVGWPADRLRQAWTSMIGAPVEPMSALAGKAVAAGLRVGLLSNTDPWHWQAAWERLPFRDFEPLGLSYELAAMKPDHAVYRNVLSAGDPDLPRIEAGSTLFVDDRPENLAAAAAQGFGTWLMREPRADLSPLASLLGLEEDVDPLVM